MARATLTITLPEDVWIQQISTSYPDATVEVLAAVPDAETGFALVRITDSDVASIVEDVDDHPQIVELSVTKLDDDQATVHFETTAPLLLFSSQASGVPIELPVEIRNGEATVEVAGSRERLSQFVDHLEAFGFTYQVESVIEQLHERQLLSERQREILLTAVEAGYYDTPRRCSLTELADRLDIAKSTCSETLHRIEETIVKRFVDELEGDTDAGLLEERLTDRESVNSRR